VLTCPDARMAESESSPSDAGEPTRGPSRLPFTRRYPDDPDLWRLVAAFERGDYRAVRAEAPRLAARTNNADVRAAALDLRRRIDPDRLQVALLVLTGALLAFLTSWFYLHAR
jgi:hypothetical protein